MTNVKTHIIAAKFSAQNPADNVLTAVLLHKIKPSLPVDAPMDHGPDIHFPVAEVQNLSILLPHIHDF